MVIQEKDHEIRRLKALWSPNHEEHVDESDEKNRRATKLLNAPELGQGKQQARFGISAEIRSSLSRSLIKTVSISSLYIFINKISGIFWN